MKLPNFKIEEFFNKYEFSTPYMLGSSDAESYSLHELLSMADHETKKIWDNLTLSYTHSDGLPLLRKEISKLYTNQKKDNILVFAGAEEAIYIAMNVILSPDDHVIVITPCYESLKNIPKSLTTNVTEVSLDWDGACWHLDLQKLESVVKDHTKLIIVNFPHNPTGYLPSHEQFDNIVQLAKKSNAYLFCDEVYRCSEQNSSDRLPNGVDCYEKALSLGVMSKSFGLPGLRIGWLACNDREVLKQCMYYKNYTSICNSAPSEILSLIALRNKTKILQRNLAIVDKNLDILDSFFAKYNKLFTWYRPRAGLTSFPKLNLDIDVDDFSKNLIKEGVLILPGSLFDNHSNHFRLGFGRSNLTEALDVLDQYLIAL